ncbi:MAG: N-acetylmuramoyl-L-alanine amidase [Lachnospiraceae bacterium]|nr:N-acetylmuramoyl-L-alanine amidase [Lachnospiraceae bacterium]
MPQGELRRKNNLITAFIWFIFFAVVATLGFWVSLDREVVVAMAGDGELDLNSAEDDLQKDEGIEMGIVLNADSEYMMEMEFGRQLKESDISMKNLYTGHEIVIEAAGIPYKDCPDVVTVKEFKQVPESSYRTSTNKVIYNIRTDRVYEYDITIKDNRLLIKGEPPADRYNLVVLCGVDTDNDILMGITEELISGDGESGIKFYRVKKPESFETDKISELSREMNADFYMELDINSNEDASAYGISSYCNCDYFNPGMTDAEAADIITRAVALATHNKGLGVFNLEENDYLRQIDIPCVRLFVGYDTNPEEKLLLEDSEYEKLIAGGIVSGFEEILDVNTKSALREN